MSAYANKKSQDSMNQYRNQLASEKNSTDAKIATLENTDPLQTRTGRALSTDMQQKLSDINEAAAGRNAVVGGSGVNTAATKDTTNQLMAAYNRSLLQNWEGNIGSRINALEGQRSALVQQQGQAQLQDAQARINAASTAAQGALNMVSAGAQIADGASTMNALNGAKPNGNGTTPNITTPTPGKIGVLDELNQTVKPLQYL